MQKSVACGPMGEGREECSQEGGTVRWKNRKVSREGLQCLCGALF